MNEFQGSYAATAAGIMLTVLLGQKNMHILQNKIIVNYEKLKVEHTDVNKFY